MNSHTAQDEIEDFVPPSLWLLFPPIRFIPVLVAGMFLVLGGAEVLRGAIGDGFLLAGVGALILAASGQSNFSLPFIKMAALAGILLIVAGAFARLL